jgi:glyoxylase-like metal-dependent hydrolase (beta-lactamase superfamily II)
VTVEIAPNVFVLPVGVANTYLIRNDDLSWVLVDTGEPGRSHQIQRAAERRFGSGSRPTAIVLTHAHPDHAGSAANLAREWSVPVYVHSREEPYITGKADYPLPDASVGGFLALVLRYADNRVEPPSSAAQVLPGEGEVPGLPRWRWHHTPGHTPGHISLYREADGVLIAGDAITTVNTDSFVAIVTRRRQVCRPPAPTTMNWHDAECSVALLASLKPQVIAAGHGRPVAGPSINQEISTLAEHFCRPKSGKYVVVPAYGSD